MSKAGDAGSRYATALVAAERSGRPFLVFKDGDDRQQVLCFARGSGSVSVGRLPASDLVIDWDVQVSRVHARFEALEDFWALVDDGQSSNGTFVNGVRVSGRRRLSDGDVVRFGATTVRFRWPRADRPRASPTARAAGEAPVMPLSSTQRRVLEALCRPCQGRAGDGTPASDQQIATELVVSVGEVRGHLRVLYAKLGVEQEPENVARARLVEWALTAGPTAPRDG